jgi:hypothetical protein
MKIVGSMLGQILSIDNIIGICCFSFQRTTPKSKHISELAQSRDNIPKLHKMSTCGLLLQQTSSITQTSSSHQKVTYSHINKAEILKMHSLTTVEFVYNEV